MVTLWVGQTGRKSKIWGYIMTRRRVGTAPMAANGAGHGGAGVSETGQRSASRRARATLAAASALTLVALAGCGMNGGRPRGPAVGASGFGNDDAPAGNGNSVIYLHHSTGNNIWDGGVPEAVEAQNEANDADIRIKHQNYPYKPHPWENNPYEYWNLWVNHSGENRYEEQPTLEQIASDFDVIVWKNCYITAGMEPDDGNPDVSSQKKTMANFKLQYEALKEKMNAFDDKTFIVWTVPPKTKGDTTDEAAELTNEFVAWTKDEWDVEGDNIYLWDYHALAMEGTPDGVHPPEGYSVGEQDSHPGEAISQSASKRFAQRLSDVMAGKGDSAPITG